MRVCKQSFISITGCPAAVESAVDFIAHHGVRLHVNGHYSVCQCSRDFASRLLKQDTLVALSES